MQFLKPYQSIIPFPSRLIDDSYEEKMVLVELMDRKEFATNLKRLLKEKPRMGSLDPTYGDYIELNDLNESLELRRNQVEDLGLTIKEGDVIDEPMEDIVKTRNGDNEISFEHGNANFFLILSINLISKGFYNLIMKDKIKYKGKNVVGAFINMPIFVGNFSVVTDFLVVENMNAYRDIVGKLFCKEINVKARHFNGMITIYNGNDSVTYQMA
ncbi:hypothetical protein Tco_0368621 [Tanacetum coccineum]